MSGKGQKHIEEEKDLGLLIDEKLNLRLQTTAAIKKTKRVLGVPLLFASLVRSHITAHDQVAGSSSV